MLGEGGFAMGLDANKYISFDKDNGLTVRNGNDGIRLNGYGLTRLRTKDGVNTWVGEAHNIYCLNGGYYYMSLEKDRAYDTILCTGSGDCYVFLSSPLVDGMAINIIDKCQANCYINFEGKSLYRANDSTPISFGNKNYELSGNGTWKFIYSGVLDAWLEIQYFR